MKHFLTEYLQYKTQISENNKPDQLQENLGSQFEATDKMYYFLKQTG